MDGGGEGITPVSNIPQQCSGRDHRNLNKQRRTEQNRTEQSEGTGNLTVTAYGNENTMRNTRKKNVFFVVAVSSIFMKWHTTQRESVTTGTG